MFISARFGLLTLRNGKWRDRQILFENFIRQAKTPTAVQPTYAFMNRHPKTGKKLYANAPASAVAHLSNGTNPICVDPENDLVVRLRRIENDKINEFLGKLYAGMK